MYSVSKKCNQQENIWEEYAKNIKIGFWHFSTPVSDRF